MGKEVILISRDINLGWRAKSPGFIVQDIGSDQVPDVEKIHKDIETVRVLMIS